VLVIFVSLISYLIGIQSYNDIFGKKLKAAILIIMKYYPMCRTAS